MSLLSHSTHFIKVHRYSDDCAHHFPPASRLASFTRPSMVAILTSFYVTMLSSYVTVLSSYVTLPSSYITRPSSYTTRPSSTSHDCHLTPHDHCLTSHNRRPTSHDRGHFIVHGSLPSFLKRFKKLMTSCAENELLVHQHLRNCETANEMMLCIQLHVTIDNWLQTDNCCQ